MLDRDTSLPVLTAIVGAVVGALASTLIPSFASALRRGSRRLQDIVVNVLLPVGYPAPKLTFGSVGPLVSYSPAEYWSGFAAAVHFTVINGGGGVVRIDRGSVSLVAKTSSDVEWRMNLSGDPFRGVLSYGGGRSAPNLEVAPHSSADFDLVVRTGNRPLADGEDVGTLPASLQAECAISVNLSRRPNRARRRVVGADPLRRRYTFGRRDLKFAGEATSESWAELKVNMAKSAGARDWEWAGVLTSDELLAQRRPGFRDAYEEPLDDEEPAKR